MLEKPPSEVGPGKALTAIARADRRADLRDRIVEAARRWYQSGRNAEAELAGLVQELETELRQESSRSPEAAP